ncbi:MAG: hypothetical protein ACOCXZ_01365 [Chloroflexota bacterium]
MMDLTPRDPRRPLLWPDAVLDLQDALPDIGPAYIVGGAVRDAYLNRPIHDLDLATPEDPIALGRRIANTLDGDFFVMDAERGVARTLLQRPEGQLVIDVAAFRGPDLLADLSDRDFTVNAMAVDLRDDLTLLIDPLGGEQDINEKVLRRCGPASIADDPIRALRAVRQSVQFNLRIDPVTISDIRAHAPRLEETSAERVRDEFFKLLALRKPATALRVAAAMDMLRVIVPELPPLRDVSAPQPATGTAWDHTMRTVDKMAGILTTISPRRTDLTAAVFDLGMIVVALDRFRTPLQVHISQNWPDDRTHEALLQLAALLHLVNLPHIELDLAAQAGNRAAALRLSGDERKRLSVAVGSFREPLDMPTDDVSLHRFWRTHGAAGVDACLLGMAHFLGMDGARDNQDGWVRLVEKMATILEAYFERYDEIVEPPVLIDGNTLMTALDLRPGRQVGDLLTAIREAQVGGTVRTVDDALALARRLLD